MAGEPGAHLASTQFAEYLRHLLRDVPRYQQRWMAASHHSGRGRLTDGLNRTSIARVIFDWLAAETFGDTDQTVDRLKHRVSRCLAGGPTHETTIGWICDAFHFEQSHREEVWARWSVASSARTRAGTPGERQGLDRATFERLREIRSRSRTVSLHEHHTIGADQRPRMHRTLQIIRALEPGIDRYPYAFDTLAGDVEVIYGGTVVEIHTLDQSIRCAEIAFGRTLAIGETHGIEYVTHLKYEGDPEPEFRRAVAGGESYNIEMRVVFESDAPKEVWWCEWPSLDESPVKREPLLPALGNSFHRWIDVTTNSVIGFTWEW